MDPLSITAAAIGISAAASTGISALVQTIGGLQDAPENILQAYKQLQNIKKSLDDLSSLSTPDETTQAASHNALSKTGISDAVNDCGTACEAFNKKLQRWTRHSTDDRLSLRDRMSVGVWNKEKIRTFRTRVETCERTVHFAVSSTQLILQEKSMRRSDAGYELIQRQMEALEGQAKEQLELTRSHQEETRQRSQELATDSHSDSDDEDSAQQLAVAGEIKEQSRMLDEAQISLGVVFAQLRAGRTHQEIGNVTTDHESMALVGMPERLVGKIDQRIGNVSTTNKSASLVGVFDQGVDMKDFFKRAS